MHAMGRFTRRLRLLVGFSQADLALRAGVSQAAISRLEAGHTRNTPMRVNMLIHLAMRDALGRLPPGLLSAELCRLMQVRANGTPHDEPLAEAIALYSRLEPARRGSALVRLRTVRDALVGAEADAGARVDGRVRRSAAGREAARRMPDRAELDAWIHRLGRTVRDLRLMAGLSQERFARRAGVSQTALSRYEHRGAATPMIVVMKVNAALRREIGRGRLPSTTEETRRLMALELRGVPASEDAFKAFHVTGTSDLETFTRLYWDVPPRQRPRFVEVVRSLVDLTLDSEQTPLARTPRRASSRRRAR